MEDTICLTGGSDGTVHLWDLKQVEDYEDRLLQNEEKLRRGLDGLHVEDEALARAEHADEAAADEAEKDGSQRAISETPCIRVLEGHSKAVTALYYEDGCLVSFPFKIRWGPTLMAFAGHRIFGQDDPSVGRQHGAMYPDDGHSLGYLQSTSGHRGYSPHTNVTASTGPLGPIIDALPQLFVR